MNRESGFTLIELVLTLVLVGVLTTVAGMALVTGLKGYMLARENDHLTQKVENAMARLYRELLELQDVASTSGASITYQRSAGSYTVTFDEEAQVIKIGTDVLLDNVESFTLAFWQGEQPWNPDTDGWEIGIHAIALLAAIEVSVEVNRSETGLDPLALNFVVHPRNNGNYGGALPPSAGRLKGLDWYEWE